MPVEFLLRTSLIAAAAGSVLAALRVKSASARHAVWFGVVGTMLLLPAWLAFGPRALLPILPRQAVQHTAIVTPLTTVAVPIAPPSRPTPTQSPRTTPNPFVILYAAGVFTLLLRLAIGTLRTSRLTGASCAVPITVGFFRPRIILPENSCDWPQSRLDAVLLHEQTHARRRDPLIQWIALLNRALFWFHPLAWWLERQLSRLAEEACDAAVLAHGIDPHDYSETLLDLSRSVELTGKRIHLAAAAPMPGAFLHHRIHRMLAAAPAPKISRPRLVCTAATCALASAILAAGTLVRAQSPQPNPKFEVASVKPFNPSANTGTRMGLDHRRFRYTDSLFGIILHAYGIKGCGNGNMPGVECALLTGGPAWIHESVFEIQAKAPDSSPDYTYAQFWSGNAPQFNLMLQSLLADRFNLKLHREQKQLAVYTLSLDRNGPKPKLKPAAAAEEPLLGFGTPKAATVQLTVKNRSMQDLAASFTNLMGRPVLDRTGLPGQFDFTMEYEADSGTPGASPLTGPSLSAALQDQLGLKLESTKAPVEVLVIDHAERPSAN